MSFIVKHALYVAFVGVAFFSTPLEMCFVAKYMYITYVVFTVYLHMGMLYVNMCNYIHHYI